MTDFATAKRGPRGRAARAGTALVSLLVLVANVSPPAAAQTTDDPVETTAGPYSVATTVAHNGPMLTVETEIREAGSDEPVTNATVWLVATQQSTADQVSADTVGNDQGRYLGELTLEDAGTWTIGIEVDSPLGAETVEVEQFEMGSRTGNQQASQLLFLGIIGVLGVGAWYVWWSSSRARRKQGGPG